MIGQCTKENVTKLIEAARKRKLVYLNVEKRANELVMDYTLIEDLSDETEQERIDTMLKSSLNSIIDLIEQLNDIIKIIEKNISVIQYRLLFDCTTPSPRPVLTKNIMIPSGAMDQKQTAEKDVNWDNVFSDKLDNEVPNLYYKKTAKKYAPITYRELIGILKQ